MYWKRIPDGSTRMDKKLGIEGDHWMLGQGTIYPDHIETGGSEHASKIKTHHNRVPEIERMIQEGRVIEPLVELYKDEVREIGRQIGLPEKMITRHPFPGPGLGVRILCGKTDSHFPMRKIWKRKFLKSIPFRQKFFPCNRLAFREMREAIGTLWRYLLGRENIFF